MIKDQAPGAPAGGEALSAQLSHAQWRPVPPPRRGEDRRAFHVSMLIPGFSLALHQTLLDRGNTAVRKYRAEAEAAAESDPDLRREAMELAAFIKPVDGMLIAQQRGSRQLPYWSRLAIAEFRKQGHTIQAIAEAFRCSPRTVVNVVRGSNFLLPDRPLTRFQRNPPAKRRGKVRPVAA